MMCFVVDADPSDDGPRAPHNDGGVLTNLPRTRPQRPSARRAAARSAAGAANGARRPRPTSDSRAEAAGKPGTKPAAKPTNKAARKAAAGATGERSAHAAGKSSRGGAAGVKRRPSARRKHGPTGDAAPRQGFESDGETTRAPVQPPGGAELVATAAEIVAELAKAGVSTGERLLKDVISRLPLS
jgi:hypothetical protein